MRKRNKMNRSYSKRLFRRTADGVHKKNFLHTNAMPMRGGIRL